MNWKGKLGSTLGMFAAILGVWWFVSRKTLIPSPAAAYRVLVAAEPIAVKETIQIQPNSEKTWSFSAPAGKYPGRLTGRWICQGKSGGILSAHDDNLVTFKLVAPDNRTIQQLDHPAQGNVDIRVEDAGVYSFTFNNAGVLRSSPRVVQFEGTYQPD